MGTSSQPLLNRSETGRSNITKKLSGSCGWLRSPLTIGVLIITLHLAFGTLVWHALLGGDAKKWDDPFYFAVVTFTTIGYGDLAPAGHWAKLFFMVYVILTLIVQLTVLASFVNAAAEMVAESSSAPAQDGPETNDITVNPMLKVKPRIMKAVRGVVVLLILVAAGSILLHYTEHVDWFDCVYWTLTTLSTVGYGDIVPKNHKVLFALFFLISVCLFAYVLGEVVGAVVELLKCRRLAAFFKDGLTHEMLQKLDKVDPDGAVSKVEFLTFMLAELNLCDSDDVHNILKMFDSLDKDKSGTLNTHDIVKKFQEEPIAGNTS